MGKNVHSLERLNTPWEKGGSEKTQGCGVEKLKCGHQAHLRRSTPREDREKNDEKISTLSLRKTVRNVRKINTKKQKVYNVA